MVEQLKAVYGNTITYATHVKGSRNVVLVWKHWGKLLPAPDGGIVEIIEMDILGRGQTFREFMEATFLGDILPVTGLPGKR